MKVRILKSFKDSPEYWGEIGEVFDDKPKNLYYNVRMSDGRVLIPYKPTVYNPQCEIVDEEDIIIAKNLVGWKLKDSCKEYEKSIRNIVGPCPLPLNEEYIYEGTFMYHRLLKAGLLDVWFDRVYSTKFKEGDPVYIVDGGDGAKGCSGRFGFIINKPLSKPTGYSGKLFNEKGSYYVNVNDNIWGLGNKCIIEKTTKEEVLSHQPLSINGYKVEKTSGGISIGCQVISRKVLESLLDLYGRDAFSISLKVDGTEITKELLDKMFKICGE